MLKGIPKNLSPQLLKVLMEMGHGDEVVIADGNFPAAANARNLVRCDGLHGPEILESILKLFPLDTFTETPVALMAVVEGENSVPEIWGTYKAILNESSAENKKVEEVERFAFYERARKAYAIITTSEEALYANVILRKGVVK